MSHTIKRICFYFSIVLFFNVFIGCNSNPDTEKRQDNNQNKESKLDDVESSTITYLTAEQMKAVDLQIGNLQYKALTSVLKANGILRVPNNDKASITSLFGGVIKSLSVEMGQHVRKGEVIAMIANPQFIQLQEEYVNLKSQIMLATQELDRQNALMNGNAGIGKNQQTATANLNVLITRRSSLRRQIEMMGINADAVNNKNLRSLINVRSPISGTISNVYAKLGSYIDVSQPVAEVVDNKRLHLDLQVFEKDLPKIKQGQTVHFTLTNSPLREYDAKVYSIGSSFVNDTKTIAIHCDVENDKTGLIDSMNVTGLVSLDKTLVPSVPNEAIVNYDGKYFIFIVSNKKSSSGGNFVKGNQVFERIEIVKGVSELGYTAITPIVDLPENVRIVIKSAFFINARLTNKGEED